jgi:hypothetical protein
MDMAKLEAAFREHRYGDGLDLIPGAFGLSRAGEILMGPAGNQSDREMAQAVLDRVLRDAPDPSFDQRSD